MIAVTYDDAGTTYDDPTLTYSGSGYVFDDIHVTVEFAFGYAPLDTTPTWQPVVGYVRNVSVSRGRTTEFTEYGPGTASIQLDNRDRRFDPEHTAGPYYGDLVPMVPARITATRAGVVYTVFYGFVTGWPTAYNTANTDAVATVTCVDATRLLSNMALPQSDYYNAVISDSPLHYWPMQEPTREKQVDVVQGLVGTLQREPDVTFDSVQAGAKYVDAPIGADAMPYAIGGGPLVDLTLQGAQPQSKVRALEMWFEYGESVGAARIYVADNDRTELFRAQVVRTTGSRLIYVDMYSAVDNYHIPQYSVTYSPRTGANHLVVSYDQTTGVIEIAVNGSTIDSRTMTSGAGSSPFIPPGSVFSIDYENTSHAAFYEFDLSSARRAAHYAAGGVGGANSRADFRYFEALTDGGFPPDWTQRQIATQNVAALRDATSLLDYARQIESAEQGAFIVTRSGAALFTNRTTADTANITALFDDTGTDLPFVNVRVDSNTVDAIRNYVAGEFRAPFQDTELVASDTTSITAYGEAAEQIDLTLFDVQSDAQTVLDTRLARLKDPRTRITRLDVNMRADTAQLLPAMASMELADDVAVSFTPTGVGDALWRAVRVQGIIHTITPERWNSQLYLAPGPVNTNGPLLVLDDATYGTLSDGNRLG